MPVLAASDHAGRRLRLDLIAHLQARGLDVHDLGTHSDASCDYPTFAAELAHRVAAGEAPWGLLVCGTGVGMAIAANKVPGVRAAVVSDSFSARATRQHNDANVLCLGERVVGAGLARDIIDAWLSATFEGGRHQARVDLIHALEQRR
jgi:ribose 5-phosphate isomerase B